MRRRSPASPRSRSPPDGRPGRHPLAHGSHGPRDRLRALGARALAAIEAAADGPALEAVEAEVLGRKAGALTVILARHRRPAGRRAAPHRGPRESGPRPCSRPRSRPARLARVGCAGGPPGRRARRPDAARATPGTGFAASPDRDEPRDRPHLRPVRLRGLREPGGRDRRAQLRGPQHPAGSPRPRPVGHDVHRRAGHHRRRPPAAADAHLAIADPRHALHASRRSAH